MKYVYIILLVLLCSSCAIKKTTYDYVLNTSYFTHVESINNEKVIDTFYGTITAYEPNCAGCIGITASGYDVKKTMYYNDSEYGNIRVIAADKKISFGSIIRISNLKRYEDLIAIVLDRGGAIGFDTSSQADLLFTNENDSYEFGRIKNAKFEILRLGF